MRCRGVAGEAGGEAVRNLADGRFPLGVAHLFIVIQGRFRRQATFASRWALAAVARTRDEVTVDGAVWIFFAGTAPRRIPTDHASAEFTVLESEARFA